MIETKIAQEALPPQTVEVQGEREVMEREAEERRHRPRRWIGDGE